MELNKTKGANLSDTIFDIANRNPALVHLNKKNNQLKLAKAKKDDEFYTRLQDIENELQHYKHHFEGKVVFCNCDDPEWSNFWGYFIRIFDYFGIKKIISTHYERNSTTYKLEYFGEKDSEGNAIYNKTALQGDGDFRNKECVELLKEADIVVTNPPFSLFREYVAQLIEYDKKFLIIGNNNAITYKDIFQLIKENRMWIGMSPRSMEFETPDGSLKSVNANWYTNLDHKKRHEEIALYRKHTPWDYVNYDNYNAIEVSKASEIPVDYDGEMGVPITFMDKFNPKQFEIVGIDRVLVEELTGKVSRFRVNGLEKYARIVIKHKKQGD